jgi:hypothetical protein
MRTLPLLVVPLLLLAACGQDTPPPAVREMKPPTTVYRTPPPQPDAGKEPSWVTVDHILIAAKGDRIPNPRHADPEEAKALAYRLLDELEKGADWDALKRKYSEDPPPGGPYALANHGVSPRKGEFERRSMAKCFGDVAFSLEIGEIGIADYDPKTCPFGWHIIKRIR